MSVRTRGLAPLVAFLVLILAGPAALAANREGTRLQLKAGTIDPLAAPAAAPEGSSPGGGVRIVQFRTAIEPSVLDQVRALGVELLGYLPDRAYVVRVPAGTADRLAALPNVRWTGEVRPEWKIAPDLGTRSFVDPDRRIGGRMDVTADLFPGEDATALTEAVRSTGAEVRSIARFSDVVRLRVRADRSQVDSIARIPGIAWIEEAAEITSRNETTKWVIQDNIPDTTPVWDAGLHGEGQVIGHIDGRIDMNSCWFRDEVDNTPGPGHRKVIAYRSNSGLGADSHGTHTAGTSAGDQAPVNGVSDYNGMAWAAKISHGNSGDISGSGTRVSNLYDYLAAAHDDGARVHTNSWGDDGTVQYTTWSQDIDRFSYEFEDSLVLFAITNGSSLKTPENAKNVVAVGASQNGTASGNHCSGGRGPTNDGRRKPEIYAPGCSIVSARNSTDCLTRSSTGTSMACPAVTGAGAIVRQYFEQGWYPSGTAVQDDALVPSGALVKATLLNSTVDMTGVAGYPSDTEGWGRLLLENALYLDGDARTLSVMADVRNAEGLATGQQAEHPLVVHDGTQTLKITVAWTEPPAALLAATATINDLDLEVVSPGGTLYRGNFVDPSSGLSLPDGTKDAINNLEMVVIDSPQTGEWTVRVVGAAVNEGTQGFAAVASGGVEPFSTGAIRYLSYTVLDDVPLGNADGIVDPGETVTLPLTFRNTADTSATNVAAIVAVDRPDDVKVTSSTASFPTIPADGSATTATPHIRFTVGPDVPCGTVLRFDASVVSSLGEGDATFRIDVGEIGIGRSAGGLPVTIAKKSSQPTVATLAIGDAFTIQDVQAAIEITHENVGELVVTLTSPAGTTVTLHDLSREGTADIAATYDAERQPDGPGTMNDFDGEQAAGTWTLSVLDNVGGPAGAGSLVAWSLDLTATAPIRCAALECGADLVPIEVAGLRANSENGADIRLSWDAVAGASGYRVWSSDGPTFETEAFVGATTATDIADLDARTAPGPRYYRVRAVNSCEWEGP